MQVRNVEPREAQLLPACFLKVNDHTVRSQYLAQTIGEMVWTKLSLPRHYM